MYAKLCKLSIVWAAAILLSTAASAQPNQNPNQPSSGETYQPGTFNRPYYGGGGGFYGGGGYGGWGWGGGMWGGGTAAGSYLNGLGNAIRSQGQYNLDTSAAAINLQEADRRAIENQKLWTQTYFEKRRINQAYRDAARRPRPSASDWVRAAQDAAPDRLPASSLDPVTGRIDWPAGLMGSEFAAGREHLDQLFADRALAHGAIGIEAHAEIRDAVDRMLALLRSRIRDFETSQYLASRRFLTSLRFEASLPTDSMDTAQVPG